jgi:hypothetical protein
MDTELLLAQPLILSEFTDLEQFKISDNDKEIVFKIPYYTTINLYGNRDNLLKMFADVHEEFEPATEKHIIRCFKRHIL